jgi:hypothetical protein
MKWKGALFCSLWCRFLCLRHICESHDSAFVTQRQSSLVITTLCSNTSLRRLDLRRKHGKGLDRNWFLCPVSLSTARITFLFFKFCFFWILHLQCSVWQFAIRLAGVAPLQFVVQQNDARVRLHRAATHCIPRTTMVCLNLWTGGGVYSYVISPWRGCGFRHNCPPACSVLYCFLFNLWPPSSHCRTILYMAVPSFCRTISPFGGLF